jgi:hypothetical protein
MPRTSVGRDHSQESAHRRRDYTRQFSRGGPDWPGWPATSRIELLRPKKGSAGGYHLVLAGRRSQGVMTNKK